MSEYTSRPKLEDNHEAEIKERWGDTPAYQEYKEKTKDYSKGRWASANLFLMATFSEFADCMHSGAKPEDEEVQALVIKLQNTITSFYYTCTDEILAGLGKMYVADERFKKNIDKYGEGTAEFASQAIAIYCKGVG